jgi:hypothetical protein
MAALLGEHAENRHTLARGSEAVARQRAGGIPLDALNSHGDPSLAARRADFLLTTIVI